MQAQSSKQDYYKSVFVEVIDIYDEMKSVHGTSSVAGFYNGLGKIRSGGSLNPRIVRCNPSDFIADIEIGARKTLTTSELAFFRSMYLQSNVAEQEFTRKTTTYEGVRYRIAAKLGRYFVEQGLFPVSKYFRPKDTR